MDWFLKTVVKRLKLHLKGKHFQNLTHHQISSCIRIKYSTKNPMFCEVDSIFHKYNTNQNKKINLYLVKHDFQLIL